MNKKNVNSIINKIRSITAKVVAFTEEPGVSHAIAATRRVLRGVWAVAKVALGAALTVLMILVICGFSFVGVLGDYLQEDILPASDMDMEDYDYELNSYLYYVDEAGEIQVYQQVFADTSSQWANYEDIPKDLINAAIAIEDHRFNEHQGVDWITTVKACARMFFGDDSVGGSSITQQLIKNMLLQEDKTADDVTVRRKVMEIFRAVQMEKRYDKETIMESYLNCIWLGQGCRGVRSAAATYFGKEVEKLTTAECASLISITNSPTYYDPYQNFENNKERKEDVLWTMKEYGYLSQEEYDAAIAQELVLKSGIDDEDRLIQCPNQDCAHKDVRKNFVQAENGNFHCPVCNTLTPVVKNASQDMYSWYTETVLEDVARDMIERDGLVWNENTRDMYLQRIQRGGYHIYTCLDKTVQDQVDKIYTNLDNIPNTRGGQQLQSGMVVIDNRTGDIVALAGGVGEKEYFDAWNRACDARVQSGSSIKPLAIYAPAFESGAITPASVIKDLPLNYNDGAWPRNDTYSYSYSRTIYSGVTSSVNAVAANTLDLIGTNYSYEFCKEKFGLSTLVESYVDDWGVEHSDKDFAPLAMGAQTWGVTVRDMATAFGTFANKGVYRDSRTYSKVYDSDGELILDNTQKSEEILSQKTVDYMNYCLVNATQSGTGYEADMSWSSGITTAGKTGTTSSSKDRWYCGFTGYYTAAVWSGFDTPEVIYTTGSVNNPSAYLFKKVMEPLHSGKSNKALYNSGKLVGVTVCLDSGKLATDACKNDIRTEGSFTRVASAGVYPEDIPQEYCDKHVTVEYCSGGGVATQYCTNFAAVDPNVKLSQKGLVKMTQQDLAEILQAKPYNLGSQYFRDDYVCAVDSDGSDKKWNGFSGGVSNDGSPYLVCQEHTQEKWEAYQSQNPVTPEPETQPPVTPVG